MLTQRREIKQITYPLYLDVTSAKKPIQGDCLGHYQMFQYGLDDRVMLKGNPCINVPHSEVYKYTYFPDFLIFHLSLAFFVTLRHVLLKI